MIRLRALAHIIIAISASFAATLILGGCNTSGCTDNHSALPMMGFYNATTGAQVAMDSLVLTGVGAPNDTALIHSGQRVKSLYFPLRNNQTSTTFRFHYDYKEQGLDNPAFDDLLTISYTTSPYFASEECGAFYIYTVTDVQYTTHLIERVEVTDSIINNIDMERFKIYFRIAEPEQPDTPDTPDSPDSPDNPETPETPENVSENQTSAVSNQNRIKL